MIIICLKIPTRTRFVSVALILLFMITTATAEARDRVNRNTRDSRHSIGNLQRFNSDRNQGHNHSNRQTHISFRSAVNDHNRNNFSDQHRRSHKSNANNVHINSHNHYNRPIYSNRHHTHRSRTNNYIPLAFAGLNFFFNNGAYYRDNGYSYSLSHNNIGTLIYRLPYGYTTLTIGNYPYYYANRNYYIRDNIRNGYLRVNNPYKSTNAFAEIADSSEYQDLFVYPNEGQNEEQINQDKYECHLWAVEQTGFDPSLGKPGNIQDYHRALSACLEGRGYTVN